LDGTAKANIGLWSQRRFGTGKVHETGRATGRKQKKIKPTKSKVPGDLTEDQKRRIVGMRRVKGEIVYGLVREEAN